MFYLWLLGSCLLLINCALDLLLLIGLGVRCFRAVGWYIVSGSCCLCLGCLLGCCIGWVLLEFGCCYGWLLLLVCLCIAALDMVVIYRGFTLSLYGCLFWLGWNVKLLVSVIVVLLLCCF